MSDHKKKTIAETLKERGISIPKRGSFISTNSFNYEWTNDEEIWIIKILSRHSIDALRRKAKRIMLSAGISSNNIKLTKYGKNEEITNQTKEI